MLEQEKIKQHYTDHNKLVFQCVCNRARWTAYSDWGETPEKENKRALPQQPISYYFGRVEGKTNQNSK